MKTEFTVKDQASEAVGNLLNVLLADEYVLYVTTRDYHWNVTGPEFHGLHQLFATQSGQIADWIDEIAERIRAVGAGARGHWGDLTKATRSSADPGIGLPSDRMLSELLLLHEGLIAQLRQDVVYAQRFDDVGTGDFLTGLIGRHEKSSWMLRAQLGNREMAPAQYQSLRRA